MKVPAKSSATGIGQRLFTRCSFSHVCVLSLFALGLQGTTSKAQNAVVLGGAGSSVPAPLYSRWAQENGKRNPNIQMRYLPVGTSEGSKKISHGAGDFGPGEGQLPDQGRCGGSLSELPVV